MTFSYLRCVSEWKRFNCSHFEQTRIGKNWLVYIYSLFSCVEYIELNTDCVALSDAIERLKRDVNGFQEDVDDDACVVVGGTRNAG